MKIKGTKELMEQNIIYWRRSEIVFAHLNGFNVALL